MRAIAGPANMVWVGNCVLRAWGKANERFDLSQAIRSFSFALLLRGGTCIWNMSLLAINRGGIQA